VALVELLELGPAQPALVQLEAAQPAQVEAAQAADRDRISRAHRPRRSPLVRRRPAALERHADRARVLARAQIDLTLNAIVSVDMAVRSCAEMRPLNSLFRKEQS
jgi:hypothetical protein